MNNVNAMFEDSQTKAELNTLLLKVGLNSKKVVDIIHNPKGIYLQGLDFPIKLRIDYMQGNLKKSIYSGFALDNILEDTRYFKIIDVSVLAKNTSLAKLLISHGTSFSTQGKSKSTAQQLLNEVEQRTIDKIKAVDAEDIAKDNKPKMSRLENMLKESGKSRRQGLFANIKG